MVMIAGKSDGIGRPSEYGKQADADAPDTAGICPGVGLDFATGRTGF
jgi:hypothetical protein